MAIREAERSLGLALRGDGGGLAGDLLGVAEVIVSDGLEIGVELIDEGNSCGDVEGDNLLVRDLIEILDQSPQTVSVGGDQNLLPGSNCGRNGLIPEGGEAIDGVFETFGERDEGRVDVGVFGVVPGVHGVVLGHERGRDVVRPSPDRDLFLSVQGSGLGLVQTLKTAVHALVEAPRADDGDPVKVELVLDVEERLDGALEDAGEGDVKDKVVVLEDLSCGDRFGLSCGREVGVKPAAEAVLKVPRAFSVADDDERVCDLL